MQNMPVKSPIPVYEFSEYSSPASFFKLRTPRKHGKRRNKQNTYIKPKETENRQPGCVALPDLYQHRPSPSLHSLTLPLMEEKQIFTYNKEKNKGKS